MSADYLWPTTPLCQLSCALELCDKSRLLSVLSQGDYINAQMDELGKTPLMIAMNDHKQEILETILCHPNINVNAVDHYGDNALYYAVAYIRQKDWARIVFHKLVQAGININYTNCNGQTLLMQIVEEPSYCFNEEYIELLLEAGADLYAIDTRGRTAYYYAQQIGRPDVIVLLNKYYLKVVYTVGGYMSIIPRDIRDYIQKFVFFILGP